MARTRKLIEDALNLPKDVKAVLFRGPDLPLWLELSHLNAALKAMIRHFTPLTATIFEQTSCSGGSSLPPSR